MCFQQHAYNMGRKSLKTENSTLVESIDDAVATPREPGGSVGWLRWCHGVEKGGTQIVTGVVIAENC